MGQGERKRGKREEYDDTPPAFNPSEIEKTLILIKLPISLLLPGEGQGSRKQGQGPPQGKQSGKSKGKEGNADCSVYCMASVNTSTLLL